MFIVTHKDIVTGVEYTKAHRTELDAVHALGAIEIYANLALVSHSPNIDRSKFRR